MKSALARTVSVPAISLAGAPSSSSSNYRPFLKSAVSSPKISLHLEINPRRGAKPSGIRRTSSESDIARSLHEISNRYDRLGGAESRSFPSGIPEDEFLDNGDFSGGGISMENAGFFGSGIGSGGDNVADAFSGGNSDRSKIGAYYERMLKLNPSDSLLLRNYGKFLHEVENDTKRAEECYGRAILANPGDGELLSLYGKLLWETQRDEQRAKSYFDRAVYASPNDCSVLGSYAHFLWEVEVEEEEEEAAGKAELPPAALVAAF